MKRSLNFLILGLLTIAVSHSAEVNQKALKDLRLTLKDEYAGTNRYAWKAVALKGGKEETKDYAVLVTSTKSEGESWWFHDTITLVPSNGGTVFERRTKFQKANLLRPEEITLDMKSQGQTVRQLTYEKGEAKFLQFSGASQTERWTFDDGILTFNALLRLAPLLPRRVGDVYTFQRYAEPFLFRIKDTKSGTDQFTLTCDAEEKVTIGKKSYDCVRFRLELKSAKVITELWVNNSNLVVKFADTLPDGASARSLVATLQE